MATGSGYNPRTVQMLGWAGLSDADERARVSVLSRWLRGLDDADPAKTSVRVAIAEVLLDGAFAELERSGDPGADLALAGRFLYAAEQAWSVVSVASETGVVASGEGGGGADLMTGRVRLALDLYNAAVGGLVEALSDRLTAGESSFYVPLPVADASGNQVVCGLTVRGGGEGTWAATAFDRLQPASTIAIEGLRFRHVTDAVGAAIVGVSLPTSAGYPDDVPPSGMGVAATAVVDFEGGGTGLGVGLGAGLAVLTIFDPAAATTTEMWGRRVALSSDYTSPLALITALSRVDLAGRQAMLTPAALEGNTRVYRLEPYDDEKIPVVFVHGLRSSPLTWRDVLNDLRADPEIRARYQFWTFLYPSGLPIPRSAYHLRTQLRAIKDRYDPEGDAPWRGKMVVIGHSMGGVISRANLLDVGARLYESAHRASIEEMDLPDHMREHLREVFYYEPEPDVSRAVFVAAPFRGSDMAESWFASIGRGLTALSAEFREVDRYYRRNNRDKLDPWFARRGRGALTGVGTLALDSPFVKAFEASPMRSGVKYHVIVGDEDGDGDGVVKHWSSYLEGTEEQVDPAWGRVFPRLSGEPYPGMIVVGSGHNAHQSLEGGAAIWRILKRHLAEVDAGGLEVAGERAAQQR